MLILQAILSLIFLIFAEKKQNSLWCFRKDASYPSNSKNLETNANQHSVLRSWMKITPSPFSKIESCLLRNCKITLHSLVTLAPQRFKRGDERIISTLSFEGRPCELGELHFTDIQFNIFRKFCIKSYTCNLSICHVTKIRIYHSAKTWLQ